MERWEEREDGERERNVVYWLLFFFWLKWMWRYNIT